jgi:hypothetical protein
MKGPPMSKRVYRYLRPETMDADDYFEFSSNFDAENGEYLAKAAAENYHNKHGGWEAAWPIELVIVGCDGSVIGTYVVDRETVPQFRATEIKATEKKDK